MALPRLIEKLLRMAVESAGAERGLLILIRSGEPQIEAEAVTGPGGIEVTVRKTTVAPSDLPQSVLTQEHVLLDDASAIPFIRRTNVSGTNAPGQFCACQSSSKRSSPVHFIWRTT